MKKVNVLLIVAMLAAALLAANPPGKLVRLDIPNGSGDTIYMRLTGRNTGAFYYLTIPGGVDKSFTVLVDSYKRTTWACGGIVSSGSLNMTGNVKLKFVLCGSFPVRWVFQDFDKDGVLDLTWYDVDGDGIVDIGEFESIWAAPNFGEPTQEKVVYWLSYLNYRWRKVAAFQNPLNIGDSFSVWLKLKYSYAFWSRVRFPAGRFMRYRY